jgi:hypothetical protein
VRLAGRQQCLLVNPAHGWAKLGCTKLAGAATGRTLRYAQWCFVLQTVSRPDRISAEQPDHFALLLAYATGMRRVEMATATSGRLATHGAR